MRRWDEEEEEDWSPIHESGLRTILDEACLFIV